MLISAICLFLSTATKKQPYSLVKDRQTSTESPGHWIAHNGRMHWGSSQLLPYTHTWSSCYREMRCCHPCFLFSDASRTWPGCGVQDCCVHQETPVFHSMDTYSLLPYFLWDAWKILQKAERWTRWGPVVSFKMYFFTFLWLPLREFPFKNSGGQIGLSALQLFRCTNKTFPSSDIWLSACLQNVALYSFYFRSIFHLSLALFDWFFFC